MLMPLLVILVSPTSPSPALLERPRPVVPAVQVWLSDRKTFRWGVRARVYAQTSADGFLLVLHADAAGRVRVLFPRSPEGDQFVRGGQTYELGDSGAAVDDTVGLGFALAAVANAPFAVNRYVRDGHWDFQAVGGSVQADPKGTLLAAVQTMQGEGLRYDLASYAESSRRHPKSDVRHYAERAREPASEPSPRHVAQQGKIFYPLAYGYPSRGWYSPMGGLNSRVAVSALLSFPYRYDQFYRGPRKVWW